MIGKAYKVAKKELDGKKAYIVGALFLVYAAVGGYLGLLSNEQVGTLALQGLGIITLRAGIAKK